MFPAIGQVNSDVIYMFNQEPLACVISDVTDEEIRFRVEDNEEGPLYTVEKDQAILVFKENGDFLLPFGSDTTWVSGADRQLHRIITKDHQILPARLLEVVGATVQYQDYVTQANGEISTEKILLIIHKDGRHELFASMTEVVEGLNDIARNLDNYAAAEEVMAPTIGTTEVNSADIVELTAEQEAQFIVMAEVKADDFGRYLSIISDKSEADEDKLYAIDAACKLFINDSSKIEVSSTQRDKKRQFAVHAYLDRLRMLPYDRVEMTWVQAQMVCGLRPGLDGNYYGVIAAQQLFKGYLDNKVVYQDVTQKDIEVVLTKYEVFDEGIKEQKWDVFLSNIGVQQTRKR